MKFIIHKFIFCWMFFLPVFVSAQQAEVLIQKLQQKFKSVKNYTADAQIDARIPFIKMLPVKAHLSFKQPDIFKVESKGIAIVPRQGFDQMGKLMNNPGAYTMVSQGTEKIGERLTEVVLMIPRVDTGEVLMGKLWIDPVKVLVLRSQLTTRSNGTVHADFTYGAYASKGLPDKIEFRVDTKKFKIPKAITGDFKESKPAATGKDESKGTITIFLSSYVVN